MAKTSGGVRTYGTGTSTYRRRMAEMGRMMASGRYSSVEMGRGGGYLAIERSKFKHMQEELDVGRILADKGYKVILLNEEGGGIKVKHADGKIFKASFEQRTPVGDSANTIKNALKHARDKFAEIALIYSKGKAFSRESVEDGIRLWEGASKYRFKRIIIVSDKGHVHIHKHNE